MSDTPSAGAFVGREHRLPLRIYYEDTDFTGLVYHANYLRYLERGRSDFLRLAAGGHTEFAELDLAFVVTRIEIDYLRAARVDDALVVRTTYDRVKGARLYVAQSVERGAEVLCRAQVTAACIDLRGRPRRPPKGLAETLGPWLLETTTPGA